jgi:hypothetical protein
MLVEANGKWPLNSPLFFFSLSPLSSLLPSPSLFSQKEAFLRKLFKRRV